MKWSRELEEMERMSKKNDLQNKIEWSTTSKRNETTIPLPTLLMRLAPKAIKLKLIRRHFGEVSAVRNSFNLMLSMIRGSQEKSDIDSK